VAFESLKGPGKSAALAVVDAAFAHPAVALRAAVPAAEQASMPSWLPSATPGEYWIAFSSSRAAPGDDKPVSQLWLTHFDPQLAATAHDPSSPALHLPFQDLDEANRRALFAADSSTCLPTPERCDGLDNDCDGTVDDHCCSRETERCGDGIDNDCDGVVDEGCP
jgi:hypothetical protein